jgi:hypothetical protein
LGTFILISTACRSTDLYRLFITTSNRGVLGHRSLIHLSKIIGKTDISYATLSHLTDLSWPPLALLASDISSCSLRAGCLSLTLAGSNIILHLVFLLLSPAFRLVDCAAYLRSRGVTVFNKRSSADLIFYNHHFKRSVRPNYLSCFLNCPFLIIYKACLDKVLLTLLNLAMPASWLTLPQY